MSCERCRYSARKVDEAPCSKCKNCYSDYFTPKTNHDKLKEMSVNELSDFLVHITEGRKQIDQLYKTVFGKAPVNFNAKQTIKKWLESEAE